MDPYVSSLRNLIVVPLSHFPIPYQEPGSYPKNPKGLGFRVLVSVVGEWVVRGILEGGPKGTTIGIHSLSFPTKNQGGHALSDTLTT